MGAIDYWIYWSLAYMSGISCLTLVLFVYFQKKSSHSELAFHGLLNLFTILFIISEYLLFVNHHTLQDSFVGHLFASDHPLVLCVSAITYTMPIWAHSKKVRPWPASMRRAVGLFCIFMGITYIAAIFAGRDLLVSYVIYCALMLMYVYTTVVLFACPSSRPHRSALFTERAYAVINVLFLPSLLLFDTYYREISWIQSIVPQRIYTFPLYYTAFCIVGGIESIVTLRTLRIASEKKLSRALPGISNGISADSIRKYNITAREIEIIELLLAGDSYSEIGTKLFISHSTVKTHIQRIYRKTNVSNKIQLVNLVRS